MDTTKTNIAKIIDCDHLAKWAPGVAKLGWTVRVEDGNVRFNCELRREYREALTVRAKEKLKEAGFTVCRPSLSMLLIS